MDNRKKMITIIFSAVCVCLLLTVILVANCQRKNADPDPTVVHSFTSLEEAAQWAEFSMQATDRLNGNPATDYSANKSVITVTFGTAGYITKTLIIYDESDLSATDEQPEISNDPSDSRTAHEIDGMTVFFTGEENAVTKAEWIDNGFDYAIVLTESSVTADVMTDYVSATR